MIRVPQTGVPRPTIFETGGDGPAETAKAVAFHTGQEGAEPVTFKVYSHATVKYALMTLFGGKCAYCESRFDATQPVDVEHWRPKGDVEEEEEVADAGGRTRTVGRKLGKGYFWLAAAWDNLLPSCIDCNRQRRHRILPDGKERVSGKGNFFPLEPGCVRARSPGDEAHERPLLLNPYRDDPSLALELGDEGVLRARTTRAGVPDDGRALPSIRVYALNRAELVLARKQVLFEMEQHMHVVRQLAALMREPLPAEVEDVVLGLLEHERGVLLGYTDARRAYAFCARQHLNRFEREMGLPLTPWTPDPAEP